MVGDSNPVLFSNGAGVEEGGTSGRLLQMERGYIEFLCSFLSLGPVVGSLVGGRGTG